MITTTQAIAAVEKSFSPKERGLVPTSLRSDLNAADSPPDIDLFRVAIVEDAGPVEVVFQADNVRSVLNWIREWLRDPIDLAVAVVPPGIEIPAMSSRGGSRQVRRETAAAA